MDHYYYLQRRSSIPVPTQFRPDRRRSEHWHSASSPDGEVSDRATRILYIESSCSTILTLLYPHCQTRCFQHNKTLSDLPPEPVKLRAIRLNLAAHSSYPSYALWLQAPWGRTGFWALSNFLGSTQAQRRQASLVLPLPSPSKP
jgi:hypothetical protein